MTDDLIIRNATVLDVMSGTYLRNHDVLCGGGRIVEIGPSIKVGAEIATLPAEERFLVPGLIDSHVHVSAVTADLSALRHLAPSYVSANSAVVLREMLHRGFTTVRDMGGADWGIARAQSEGLIRGPRILFCGHALSQTGGHGDFRASEEKSTEQLCCCAGIGVVADGVNAVRLAAREELRKGANHIKVMASGGVASPTDRIDSSQYSLDELRAAVDEAGMANRYVAAHAYTAKSINRAVEAGVRSIEHGNLLDDTSIQLMLDHSAFLVPTLVTYWALKTEGLAHSFPPASVAKVDAVLNAGLQALDRAASAGVRIAFGSDLLGPMHRHQSEEFRIRAHVRPLLEILRSATSVAAELVGMVGEIGCIASGARADMLLLDADPLRTIEALANPQEHLKFIVQAGRVIAREA